MEVNENTWLHRAQLIFTIIALSAAVLVIVLMIGGDLIDNIRRLENHQIYVSASSWDIPTFVGLPSFIALIFLLSMKLVNKSESHIAQRVFKLAVICAILAIVVRIPYGFVLSSYLSNHGYSRCAPLTSPALMSPAIWVRSNDYCIADAGSVRRDLLDWLNSVESQHETLSPADVQEKALILLKVYDEEQMQYLLN